MIARAHTGLCSWISGNICSRLRRHLTKWLGSKVGFWARQRLVSHLDRQTARRIGVHLHGPLCMQLEKEAKQGE